MTLDSKLRIASYVPAVMALIISLALFVSFRSMEDIRGMQAKSQRIIDGVHELNSLARSYVLYHENRPKMQFLAEHESIAGLLDAMRVDDAGQGRVLARMQASSESLNKAFLRLVSHYEQHRPPYSDSRLKEAEERFIGQLFIRSRDMVSDALLLQHHLQEQSAAMEKRVNAFILLFVACSAVPFMFVMLGMRRRILAPITALQRSVEAVAGGNLEHRVRLSSKDEIGTLAGAFDHMIEQLQGMTVSRDKLQEEMTERIRAEEALRQSETILRAVTENNPDPIFMKDKNSRLLFANPATLRLIGRNAEDAIGKTDEEFYDNPADGRAIMENDRRIMASGQKEVVEESLTNPDGSRRFFLSSKAPYCDHQGRIAGLIGVAHDITDRKQAEEVLRRLNEQLEQRVAERTAELQTASQYTRRLIEASLDPLVTISPEGQITDVNQATEAVTGVGRSRLIGSDFSDYFTDPDSARSGYRKVIADGQVQDYPLTILNASGRTIDVLYNATIYRNEGGGIQGVFAAARDITDRKRAEEALKAERQRLYDVLETLPAMICLLTPDYHVTFANKSFRDRFGESHGRHCYEYCFGKAEPCEFCESYTVLKTGKPHRWEVKSPDGSIIAAYDFPFTDTDGSPLILEMDVDITEQRRAEEELVVHRDRLRDLVSERTAQLEAANVLLQKEVAERIETEKELRVSEEMLRLANEHLEQRVRDRTMDLQNLAAQLEQNRDNLRKLASELVLAEEQERKRIAAVLHDEIAQTLAVARMRVDMLQRTGLDDESGRYLAEAKEFLVQSIRETRALMNELGNPLLFDMGVAAACESLADRLMAVHPKIRIRCDICDSFRDLNPEVKVVLFQVIRELLNNVIKHSGARNAHVLVRMDDGRIRAEVKDDGMGFDPKKLGTPTSEGGFGLFSIRERLIAFNGDLRIDSTPETGTVVTASLPLKSERALRYGGESKYGKG